jgi:hypothetical protein
MILYNSTNVAEWFCSNGNTLRLFYNSNVCSFDGWLQHTNQSRQRVQGFKWHKTLSAEKFSVTNCVVKSLFILSQQIFTFAYLFCYNLYKLNRCSSHRLTQMLQYFIQCFWYSLTFWRYILQSWSQLKFCYVPSKKLIFGQYVSLLTRTQQQHKMWEWVHYLSCYSPTGPEPAMGVGEEETMFIRPWSFTIGSVKIPKQFINYNTQRIKLMTLSNLTYSKPC